MNKVSRVQRQKIIWILSTAVFSFFLAILIISLGLHSVWKSRSDEIYNATKAMDELVQIDLSTIKNLAKKNPQQECTELTLKSMRMVEFEANNLYEFGVIRNNQLICTTIQGILSPPRDINPINLGNEGDIQVTYQAKVHADNDLSAMQVKFKHFRALLKIAPLPLKQVKWINIGIFTLTDVGFTQVHGNSSIMPSHTGLNIERINRFEKGYWVEEFCIRKTDCGVVSVDIRMFLSQERGISFVLTILIISIVMLSSYVSLSFHRRHISYENQLKRGLNSDRVILVYQPIYFISDMSYNSCEVLCRWQDENHETLRPDLFIEQIELNGQSRELTEIVIKKAITELKAQNLLGKIDFAVNMFPDDISSGHAYKLVKKYLKSEFMHTLTLEITENEIADMAVMKNAIIKLRKLNLKISIDDFGTGYSNFQHLEELHIDHLKIDKSFIRGVENQAIRSCLVKHIVNMAKGLNLKIVAEGVEKTEQLAIIEKLGVEMSQGYLHSRPIPIGALRKFLDFKNNRYVL